ncbi:MAG: NAD(P)H-hydrate dehydratase [Candidatus Xenobia bacterium]
MRLLTIDVPKGAWQVLSADEAAAVDRRTIEEIGVPGAVLMETAGRAAVRVIDQRWPGVRRVVVACGPGNNGGDGFVIARALFLRGVTVHVFLLGDSARLKGNAALNYQIATNLAIPVNDGDFESRLAQADLAVDALFGTGLERPLEGPAARMVAALNASSAPCLAVDIPSGVEASSGQILGTAVKADASVTFGWLKSGHLVYPGAGHTGALYVADIGFPPRLAREMAQPRFLVTHEMVQRWMPRREDDAHKGTAGRVLVVGGSTGLTGAPVMSSEAALRAGAGLSTVAVPATVGDAVAARLREVMVHPLPDDGRGTLTDQNLDALLQLAEPMRVLAVGPGMGRDKGTQALIRALVTGFPRGVVVDADALHALSGVRRNTSEGVLTPHFGEMAALLDVSIADVSKDPVGCAREAARRFNMTCVLKGAHTITATPGGEVFFNFTGNSGMASGGMGDVLTGVIAGLMAQGMAASMAAVCGVFVHGLAGDLAASEVGPRGLLAGDVMQRIPRALVAESARQPLQL